MINYSLCIQLQLFISTLFTSVISLILEVVSSDICGWIFWKIIPFTPKFMAAVVICTRCAQNRTHSTFHLRWERKQWGPTPTWDYWKLAATGEEGSLSLMVQPLMVVFAPYLSCIFMWQTLNSVGNIQKEGMKVNGGLWRKGVPVREGDDWERGMEDWKLPKFILILQIYEAIKVLILSMFPI